MFLQRRIAWIVALALPAAACGGGSSGARFVDVAPPVVTLETGRHAALTDLETATIRGSASDASGVAEVTVNGVAATSADGFASWQAPMTLQRGDNTISVDATDGGGRTRHGGVDGALRGIGRSRVKPDDVDIEAATGRAIVIDEALQAVLAIDLDDGTTTTVADPFTGAMQLSSMEAVTVDDDAGIAYVLVDKDTVVAFDLTSGDRTDVTGPARGSGPPIFFGVDLEFDSPRDRLLVLDLVGAIIAVDVVSGDREIVADDAHGSGPSFPNVRGISLDLVGDLLLIVDGQRLLAVDPGNGDRKELSGSNVGIGPSLGFAFSVDWVPGSRLAWIVSLDLSRVLEVDLVTGDRVVLSDDGSAGPAFVGPIRIAVAPDGSFGLLVDQFLPDLFTISAIDGSRAFLDPEQFVGAGERFGFLLRLALDPNRARVYVSQFRPEPGTVVDEIVAADLATGDRSLISGPTRGQGDTLDTVFALRFDAASDRLFALTTNIEARLIAIDPDSGDRTLISDTTRGTGTPLAGLGCIALDPRSGRVFAEAAASGDTSRSIVEVDVETGDRIDVTGPRRGTGPVFASLRAIAVDPVHSRLVVASASPEQVVGVDLATGNRVVLSDASDSPDVPLTILRSVDVDASGTRALVAAAIDLDSGFDQILDPVVIDVDLATGERRLVTANVSVARRLGPGGGLFEDSCRGMTQEEVFVLDARTLTVLSIDLITGERAIVSR